MEDGWKKGQERQENRTHYRTLSVLRKIIQIRPKQKKNLNQQKH